jgi:hypothetical protein
MSDQIQHFIEKNKLIVLVAVVLLIVYGFGPSLSSLTMVPVVNPGFEGAKCDFYGAVFNDPSLTGSPGAGTIHVYQDAVYEQPLVSYSDNYGNREKIYWAVYDTPNNLKISWQHQTVGIVPGPLVDHPDLGIHVQSDIQLEDISRQGDPLHWNDSDVQAGRQIEYWTMKAVKTSETSEKVTYSYVYTKQKCLITPAEFWIGFYVDPAQQNAQTGSGWREGEWHNVQLWFTLRWDTWNNAYQKVWANDNDPNVNRAYYPNGTVTSTEPPSEQFGTGFPIAAFIKGWEKAGWDSSSWESGPVSNPNEVYPVWLQTRGTSQTQYTPNDLANLKDALMAKASTSPGLVGDFLTLMDAPGSGFTYEAKETDFSDANLVNALKAPDTRMKSTMYFPVTVSDVGTYSEVTSAFLGIPTSWRIYYPSVYYRVRILYGVIGNFTYLWTEDVAKSALVNYPNETERVGTRVIQTQDVWGMSWSWLGNPFNQLWLFFGLMVIVVVAVTVLNPGMWSAILSRKKR